MAKPLPEPTGFASMEVVEHIDEELVASNAKPSAGLTFSTEATPADDQPRRRIPPPLGIPDYEEEVMARAVTVDWLGQRPLHLISCEDLIIHKCVAGRARDIEDVKSILWRQAGKIRMEYIRKWLGEFLRSTQEDSLECFEQALRESEPQDS
ncbi:hypothetical protein MYX82_10815 [Acidobacteria bacterium AH-259-D05]|nr:hypothetical protein [Acidobacteria bacterium AH-259-D05]